MSSKWKRACTEGQEAGRDGFSQSDNPYKDETLRRGWAIGWEAGAAKLAEAQDLLDAEQAWRDLVLAPLAERFDATTEVMEDFVDMLVSVIEKGKRV